MVLGIDMVIGVPEAAQRGGRACDRAARALLGWPRSSSVFSPPVRAALACATYQDALAVNRASSEAGLGISIEAFHLIPKMRTLDVHMTPARQERVREVHPELSFRAMHGGEALARSKHTAEGRALRRRLLQAHGFPDLEAALAEDTSRAAKADDWLDAHAACWTARRIADGTAVCFPESPPLDARGLRMEVWF